MENFNRNKFFIVLFSLVLFSLFVPNCVFAESDFNQVYSDLNCSVANDLNGLVSSDLNITQCSNDSGYYFNSMNLNKENNECFKIYKNGCDNSNNNSTLTDDMDNYLNNNLSNNLNLVGNSYLAEISSSNLSDLSYGFSYGSNFNHDYSSNYGSGSNVNKTIFLISDNPGTNILDLATKELFSSGLSGVTIIVRSGNQVKLMSENELYNLINSSDAFVGEWISSDVDAVLTSILGKYPKLSNKQLFLILEPPTGQLTSTSTSLGLIRNNTINYTKIFNKFSNDDLINYFTNTKRGVSFTSLLDYLSKDNAKKFNPIFNKLIIYKNLNNKENLLNQLLFVLNYLGLSCNYEEPIFTEDREYGIYRDKWYSLDDYIDKFFDKNKNRTIGILESTMYINSQQLQPCYEIMEQLESKGYNVIPVFAAGGSANQLKVMLESFTNAPDVGSFLNNPTNYKIYVDAIVSMVAYGVGGECFANTTSFFEQLGVPVFRAVHSDYVSNAEWELSSTGLTTTKSDKWWHVTIAETQGIFDATFVGGASEYISNDTGATITGYIPHTKNIDLLTDRISSWVDLQYIPNSDKKISIIYYNYPPGKQNIGSSYLDSITSIYNMLYTLKDAGYSVDNLPKNVSQLEDMMIKCGINVANWAPGELEKLANMEGVTLLSASEYFDWYNSLDDIVKLQISEGPISYIGELTKRSVQLNYTITIYDTIDDWYNQIVALLPENKSVEGINVLKKIVSALKLYANSSDIKYYNLFLDYYDEFKSLNISGLNGWGEAPGNIMIVNRNGTDYIVVPGLSFGDIFVAPEPQRGWEADINNLYHCTAVAPTHQYLAAYYYMQTRYSNAMVFVGRHATHEWLPGKEILLSHNDYGSIVVGDVPQLYFYISDGLGEAIQAKRRGFAVMISHLTSPMAFTKLYGNLSVAANLIYEYENSFNQSTKNLLDNELRNLIIANQYYINLGLTINETKNVSIFKLISATESFLKETQDSLYPLGLHAIGQPWNDDDLANTVSVMLHYDFDLIDKTSTNLFKELSMYYYSKDYSNLNAFEREFIINKSYGISKALIYWDVDTLSKTSELSKILKVRPNLLECLNLGKKYVNLINESISSELNSMINGLNGKYIPVGEGGELIVKPSILPTGFNMFQDQSSELPTQEAYSYAKTLALLTLSDLNDTTEKIIMGIWCVETARDDGALVATVLYLLGMEPIWTNSASAGVDAEGYVTGKKVSAYPKVVSLENLVRPDSWAKKRIDVTVITSGLFRDLYSSQAILLDNAFRMALACSYFKIINNKTLMNGKNGAKLKESLEFVMNGINYQGIGNESLENNYVAKHWIEDCLYYLSIGYNASYAGECAITRIFAPPNGDYGAGIAKLVSMSWTWNDTSELAQFYLGRMGNMYSKNYWGDTNPLVFLRALSNSDTIVASRNTNQYGVLDNDDFFDYWGGLSMTVEHISGNSPKMNILMYADKNHPYSSSFEDVMYKEILARYDNPNWIAGMMKEGYSGARYMSNKFITNLFGWQVTRPSAVSNELWDRVYNTYYKDKYGIGVKDWLSSGNNAYSLISMSGTMLTAISEGYWKADDATIRDIANTWAQATVKNGVACCDCSCGNVAMMQWAVNYVNPDILAKLLPKLYEATQNPVFANISDDVNPIDSNPEKPSTPNPEQGSNSTTTVESNFDSSSESQESNSNSNPNSNLGVGLDAGSVGAAEAVSQDGVKASEINPVVSKSASETGLSLLAVLAVISLVVIVGVGYFRRKKDDKEFDENFDLNFELDDLDF